MKRKIINYCAIYNISVIVVYVSSGYFPWMLQLLRLIFSYTEAGKAMDSMKKVAVDLIRSRRESGHKEKVLIVILTQN